MKFQGFCNETYPHASLNVDAQRAVNLYPEVGNAASKSKIALRGTPGLATFCTLATSPVRGLWAGDERLFAAAGTKVYEISSAGVATELGTIANDAANSPVQMFPNGNQLFIVSAGKGYLADGVSVTEVIDAVTGCFLDSYFIVQGTGADSKKFFRSALLDGGTWDPLDYNTKEGYPDNIASIIADHEELWLVGDQTTEVWRNEGNPDDPFRRDPGAFIHQGTVATWSVCNFGNGIAFLGGDTRGRSIAWRTQGFQPIRCSTHAVETAWSAYTVVSDAISYSYVDQGHFFWVLTFPTQNATWVYDLTTNLWHERGWWNGTTIEKHRGRCYAFTFGKHFLGDHSNGKVYEMKHTYLDDAGTPIHRLRTAPHLNDENLNLFHHRFQLDVETGAIADPAFTLEVSNDGGHTFGAPKSVTAGAVNAFTARVIWRRLGDARDRVYRVQSSAAIAHTWIEAYLDVSKGSA